MERRKRTEKIRSSAGKKNSERLNAEQLLNLIYTKAKMCDIIKYLTR